MMNRNHYSQGEHKIRKITEHISRANPEFPKSFHEKWQVNEEFCSDTECTDPHAEPCRFTTLQSQLTLEK